jgi:AcrR family transcriptional regulator
MPREYHLGKRGEAVTRARARVVAAARKILSRRGYHALSVDHVADVAGVSRATVYNQFGSKPGIFSAVFADIGRRMRFRRISEAMELPDPRRAVHETLKEYVRAWERERKVIGRILGLTAVDPQLAQVAEEAEHGRRERLRPLVDRLQQAGAVASGISSEEAAAVLGMLTSFHTCEQLRSSGLRRREAVKSLAYLAGGVIEIGRR